MSRPGVSMKPSRAYSRAASSVSGLRWARSAPAAKPRSSSHEESAAPMPRRRAAGRTATPARYSAAPARAVGAQRVRRAGGVAVEGGERDVGLLGAEQRLEPVRVVGRVEVEDGGVEVQHGREVGRAGRAQREAGHGGRGDERCAGQGHHPPPEEEAAVRPRHLDGDAQPPRHPPLRVERPRRVQVRIGAGDVAAVDAGRLEARGHQLQVARRRDGAPGRHAQRALDRERVRLRRARPLAQLRQSRPPPCRTRSGAPRAGSPTGTPGTGG